MRLLIFNIIIGTFLFSYNVNAQTNNVILREKYALHKNKKSLNYNLSLKKDSTFLYTVGFGGSLIAKCKGKWNLNDDQDSIILKCDQEGPLTSLNFSYMENRINSFKIKKKGKVLKNEKITLKAK